MRIGVTQAARQLCAAFAIIAMQATAQAPAALADAGFDRWVRDFWPTARAAGISSRTYNTAFAGLTPDPQVLEKARYQPEFVQPIWDYVDKRVSDKRIADGRAMLAAHRRLFDTLERHYGVDRHIVAAIWGMESSYGAVLDDPKIVKSVIRSLATLAYGDRRRSKYASQQLVASLEILQRGDISLGGFTGSWAGAMGHTQFIPTSYQAYAVDFDGDGRRDIWTSPVDALASAANYLAKAGWVSGKTWGYEVSLPRGFDYRLADEGATRTIADWTRIGVRRANRRPFPRSDDRSILVAPAGAGGPAFLMLRNHYVIKRYNNATAYALAVGHLADRLRGGAAFRQPWPSDARALREAELRELQKYLARSGHYDGEIDGKIGPMSVRAIRAYQVNAGLEADGFADHDLLVRLRGG